MLRLKQQPHVDRRQRRSTSNRRSARAARGGVGAARRRSAAPRARGAGRRSALIEYESVSPSDREPASIVARFSRRRAGGHALAARGRARPRRRPPPGTTYNGIRLAAPVAAAAPRLSGACRSRRRISSIRPDVDSDRRRPPALRRRFPDRGDDARRARSIGTVLSPGQPDPAADHARGRSTTSTPSAPRRDRTRPRWSSATASSTIRATACSRCGTWAATRRTPATPSRTTASRGRSRRSTSCPAPTSSLRAATATRRTVWLDLDGARSGAALQDGASGTTTTCVLLRLARRHPLDASAAGAGPAGDRTTFFYNPFRKVWVFSIRDDDPGAAARSAATGRRPISSQARAWARGPAGAVGRRRRRRPAAARLQRAGRALQPRLRRLRERAARPVHDLARRAQRSREAERHLRRLQPRRLSLGAARPAGLHPGVRARRRLELGATCSRRAAAAWSSATSCTSTSAAGAACRAPAIPGVCSTGLATLRRDGFASMTDRDDGRGVSRVAAGDAARHARHTAGRLQRAVSVRQRAHHGRAPRRDPRPGRPVIAPYSAARCVPVSGDGPRWRCRGTACRICSALAGRAGAVPVLRERRRALRVLGQPVGFGREPRLRRRRAVPASPAPARSRRDRTLRRCRRFGDVVRRRRRQALRDRRADGSARRCGAAHGTGSSFSRSTSSRTRADDDAVDAALSHEPEERWKSPSTG